METYETDVVVLGSGAAGLSAAVVAAHSGLKVLLAEKERYFGGSSAISGGVVWIPNNPLMADIGVEDSREAAKTYLQQILGNRMRHDLVDAFLENGPEMVRFMHQKTALRLIPRAHAPDYYPNLKGAAPGGRAMDPQVYEGRQLGTWFAALKWPLKEFLVFGGMMVGRKEIDQLLGTMNSVSSFLETTAMILRLGVDSLFFGRGTRLLQGNSLVAQLFKSALSAGVDFWAEAKVTSIEMDGGRISVIRMTHDGQDVLVRAKRGVVLAGGGSPSDKAGMRPHLAHPDSHYTMAPAGNTGDLQKFAVALGAQIDSNVVDPANYAPVSVLNQNGKEIRFPHLFLDRAKPGLIAVNGRGRRFVNEATSYHQFVQGMHSDASNSAVPAWLICDADFLRRYGMGLVRPGIGSRKRFLDAGYLYQGRSPGELAQSIGVPAAALEDEITKHNKYCVNGHDPDFGKGGNEYDRHQGDLSHTPNPCLGPIAKAPFYAVKVFPGDIGSTRGLVTDASARVLDGAGKPIPGLYACGNDMNSVMAGTYPGAGITLGPGLTFGYIAAREIASNQPE